MKKLILIISLLILTSCTQPHPSPLLNEREGKENSLKIDNTGSIVGSGEIKEEEKNVETKNVLSVQVESQTLTGDDDNNLGVTDIIKKITGTNIKSEYSYSYDMSNLDSDCSSETELGLGDEIDGKESSMFQQLCSGPKRFDFKDKINNLYSLYENEKFSEIIELKMEKDENNFDNSWIPFVNGGMHNTIAIYKLGKGILSLVEVGQDRGLYVLEYEYISGFSILRDSYEFTKEKIESYNVGDYYKNYEDDKEFIEILDKVNFIQKQDFEKFIEYPINEPSSEI